MTCLLQKSLVGDDTVRLIDPADRLCLTGFILQIEVSGRKLIHEISAVQCKAIVFPVLQRTHVTDIE